MASGAHPSRAWRLDATLDSREITGRVRLNSTCEGDFVNRESLPLMSSLETTNGAQTKSATPTRPYATSVKAIMHSRHANTRRNIKRAAPEPWIGEMIVVKEYDQMDSLRELLDKGARKYLDKGGPAELDVMEDVMDEEFVFRTPRSAMKGLKRKRDEDEDLAGEEEMVPQDLKRRKIVAVQNEGTKCSDEEMSPALKLVHTGKENIPPSEEVIIVLGTV